MKRIHCHPGNAARHLASRLIAIVITVAVVTAFLAPPSFSQEAPDAVARLGRDYYKNGAVTLAAFSDVSSAVNHSIVKLDVDGITVALATIVDTQGSAMTKASQLKEGRLTAWLTDGREVPAERLGVDEENDVALVRIHADGLSPVRWARDAVMVGQWAITPGISHVPHAIGIISVPPRRILHKRALIGVQLDFTAESATIDRVLPGFGAAEAGLRPGDVILAVNEDPVKRGEELIAKLREFRDGSAVSLRVRRAGEEFDASIPMKLEETLLSRRGSTREERMNRMGGELSLRAEGFELALQHDTVLPPWLCGGPLVNVDGQAIGVNIARAGRVASYALPAALAREIAARLLEAAGAELSAAAGSAAEGINPAIDPHASP